LEVVSTAFSWGAYPLDFFPSSPARCRAWYSAQVKPRADSSAAESAGQHEQLGGHARARGEAEAAALARDARVEHEVARAANGERVFPGWIATRS